jgi:hypothetical protein
MPVLIENPISFEIQKLIIGHKFDQDVTLSLIDPDGHEIYQTLANIPQFGFTRQPTPNHRDPAGFPGVAISETNNAHDENDPLQPTFEPEAIITLDSADIALPQLPEKTRGIWVIQVKNQKDEAFYVSVAKFLAASFNDEYSVLVSSAFKDNPDVETASTSNLPPYQKGSLFCPVGISRATPVKAEINAVTKSE